jgi:hypothetical protein
MLFVASTLVAAYSTILSYMIAPGSLLIWTSSDVRY